MHLPQSEDSPIRKWLRPPYSIDGWRLDVANMTGNFWRTQHDSEVWREMRAGYQSKRIQRAYMMGEYFPGQFSAHLQGDELDASMNYQGFNTRRYGAGLAKAIWVLPQNQPFGDGNPLPTESLALQWRQYLTAIPVYDRAAAIQPDRQPRYQPAILRVTEGDHDLVQSGHIALLMGFPWYALHLLWR